ncbi:hypothetical protein EXU57_19715 [Segetibacter sp. 3557_3]|uniref:hypothetical protein n=1 Tax=Segetibacter sp. 3557_3 TaxID=2547429 RepID=UPI00105917B1|nr:hypothetical protein [Segetibacter sp. 3557_3]TDH21426.1 hypothetical protein EXU57_19715 [Segetibacter sp. 3557_3]
MMKPILGSLFILSLILYVSNVDLGVWTGLIILFTALSIINFVNCLKQTVPFGELIALMYLVQNTVALTLLNVLKGDELKVGDDFYTRVSLEEYIPFSFLTCQALLLGYTVVKIPPEPWLNFLTNFREIIKKESLFYIFILGAIGTVIQSFNISALSYVTYTLTNFFSCALIGLALYYRSITNIYFVAGLALNLYGVMRSGMFGSFTYFILYTSLIFLTQKILSTRKFNYLLFSIIGIVGIWALALLQNIKTDYRNVIWLGNEDGNSGAFYNSFQRILQEQDPMSVEYYLPILHRLNQAWLVSAAMEKVPESVPFYNGLTILTSVRDAFIPRVLNPEKEEAGGRQKIETFTNIVLVEGTSMNIGLLGESYVNFGKLGAVFFMFLYGTAIGWFMRKVLTLSLENPLILVLFPIFFEILVGSEADFLSLINGVVKNAFFMYLIIRFISTRVSDRDPAIG